MNSAYNALNRGEYAKAVDDVNKINPSSKDGLLYLLDKGTILHAAGQYKESNDAFTKAEELSDAYSVKSVSREVAGTLWSAEGIEYAGDKHERAMIPAMRMLNYALLGDFKEAVIEARRTNLVIEKVYGSVSAYNNAFILYLAGVVWETLNQINDTVIDLKKILNEKDEVPYYAYDINALNKRLGMSLKLPPKDDLGWHISPDYREKKGELIVVFENGVSPRYDSVSVATAMYTVSIPKLVNGNMNSPYVDIKVNGKEVERTYPFYNVMKDMEAAQKIRETTAIKREAAKIAAQTGLYVTADKLTKSKDTEKQIGGIAAGLLAFSMSMADQADERSWRTLPCEFQLARIYLDPGTYEIEIVPKGFSNKTMKRTVEINDKTPSVILVKF